MRSQTGSDSSLGPGRYAAGTSRCPQPQAVPLLAPGGPSRHQRYLHSPQRCCCGYTPCSLAPGGQVRARCLTYSHGEPRHRAIARNSLKPTCRNSLPAGHPLCKAAAASSIPQQADQLGRLHTSLHGRKVVKKSAFRIRRSNDGHNLRATANHQGTLLWLQDSSCADRRVLYWTQGSCD